MRVVKCFFCLAIVFLVANFSFQNSALGQVVNPNSSLRPVQTAIPSLRFAPDAPAMAMGEAQTAFPTSSNTIFWNPAGLCFLENDWNFGLSYSPYLRSVVNDMWLSHFTVSKKIGAKQSLGFSARYFGKGVISFQNSTGNTEESTAYDLSLDLSYAILLSQKWSVAGTFRYIRSEEPVFLANTFSETQVNTAAVDISVLYKTKFMLGEKEADFNWGANISNVGGKVEYTAGVKGYLPTNLAIGTALGYPFNENNKVSLTLDAKKLLVPSPGQNNIMPQENAFSAMFSSFTDAPDGFSEEIQEIAFGFGSEYSYKNKLFFRAGYHYEHENKGNRRYAGVGLGYAFKTLSLNVSYLINNQSLYDDTVGISLLYGIKGKNENS